jgi:predicted nucleic acid-binding protein
MPAGKRRDLSTAALERFLERVEHRIAPFDQAAAEAAAALASQRKKRGRPDDLRDTMIAGIALASHADAIATHNTVHFGDLSIKLVDPWR